MRKSLLLLGVAVAALASCTQNEVVDIAESNVIKFDNAFVGKATKAVTSPELTTDNIEDMYVFAVDGNGSQVFTNQPENVYRTAENAWGYTNLVPWEDTKSYEFRAYAGKYLENAVKYDNENDALNFTGIVVDGAEGNQFDLLYSNWVNRTNSGSAVGDKSPIAFTFEHLLSMVKFTLKSGFGESTKVAIKDFKFYGLKTTGDYNADGTSETWALKGAANTGDDTNFKGNEAVDGDIAYFAKAGAVDVENSWVIIPQTNNESDESAVEMVKFTVNLIDKDIMDEGDKVKNFIVKLPKITWLKGYRYNYIFTITPENMEIADKYITFDQPIVNKWEDGGLTVDGETNSTEGVEIGH